MNWILRTRTAGFALAAGMLAVAALTTAPSFTTAQGRDDDDDRSYRSSEDFAWRGRVAAGKTIEVKGVNGGIVAEGTTGNEVVVTATKRARRSDPDDVQIEVIEHEDGITICAVYPTPRGERPNRCAPGEGGQMNTRNNDVNVEFRVRVPAGVRFAGRTVNGGITARGLGSDVEVATVNGGITVATRGHASAATVNGSIDVEMDRAPDEPLDFTTVNGGITIELPSRAGAEVRASTVNGGIETDFPLTVRGKFNRRRMNGTIGSGGPAITLTTVNGDIVLRSRS